jgi:nickel transport protein
MSAITSVFIALVTCLIFTESPVLAHSIHYEVQPTGISVKIFYAANDPSSYSGYEIYGPGDAEAYQLGRTDKAGIVSFLPDRAGLWKIKVLGESSHGFHGETIEVKVDQAFQPESFTKPLVAQYTKVIVGVSIIFGLFGIYALWRSKRNPPFLAH